MPKFSIITPTIQRPSLSDCVNSVNSQTFTDWEHIVQIDNVGQQEYGAGNRKVFCCGVRHGNFGNTCRHLAWEKATGEWLLHLDDDNTLADINVLEDLAFLLQDADFDWAIIPMLRHGHRFFNDPPGLCMTDTANVIVRRDIGQWPDGPEYTMDGIWVERLKVSHPNYMALPGIRPLVVMEKSSEGK